MALPTWVKPQLTKLVDQPPDGPDWLHEIKLDGYRMHARLDRGAVGLLTRTGLHWTHKYPEIAAAVTSFPAREAYLDGELCGIRPDGSTSFSLTQKERLRELLSNASSPLQFSDHQIGRGRAFYEQACGLKLEGIISKRTDAPYAPGNRGLWLKVKCLNREEFVVVGWTDPEGTRPHLGALLLAYYDPKGRLIYAGPPAPASAIRSSNGCGSGCNRWRHPLCRSMSRRGATAASDRRWS
jgi:bifunctional non-homologous end joining protein LigD